MPQKPTKGAADDGAATTAPEPLVPEGGDDGLSLSGDSLNAAVDAVLAKHYPADDETPESAAALVTGDEGAVAAELGTETIGSEAEPESETES